MNSKEIERFVGILLELLQNAELKRLPLSELEIALQKTIRTNNKIDISVDSVIHYALDNWIVDKILDYNDSSMESIGQLIWYIGTLNKEETEALRNLPDVAKVFLKMLRSSNEKGRLGVIRADDALNALREKGYDIEYAPYIPSKTDDFFRQEDEKVIQFHYLISEEEKSEEYKAGLRELDEKNRRRLDRMGY